jgi:hypothetical protein
MASISTANLLWGILFGAIGFGFFIYGKKQKRPVPFLCGLGLMVFPYFVSNTPLLVVTGGVLTAVPFVFKP